MGSIVKSIGKAIGKIGKSIGKLVKKALPIVLMAGVAYMGVSAFGAMGSGLSGAAAASGATNYAAGSARIAAGGQPGLWNTIKGIFGMGSPSMGGGMAGGMATGTAPSGVALQSLTGGGFGASLATSPTAMFDPSNFTKNIGTYPGIGTFSGPNSAPKFWNSGMGSDNAIANAMQYQSDMMWKGTLLKAAGAGLSAMFDESDEIAKRNLDITEDEFKRRHTYGGFPMDSGKPSDYAKPGQPGHDPLGFWGQIGGPPQYASNATNKGGPRQFQQAGLKTPNVNQPGLINSRQGQRQAGLLGQPPKSVV